MRFRRALASLALAGLGLVGLNNATAWPGARTSGQRLAVVVAVAAGLLALGAAVALWRRAAGLRGLLLACAAATAAAAGLAPWAWGGAPASAWGAAAAAGAGLAGAVAALAWPPRAP
jgi:hypothetical protein